MSSMEFVLSLLSLVLLINSYLCCVFPPWCTCLLCKLIHLGQESQLLEPVRDQKHQCQNSGELVSVSWDRIKQEKQPQNLKCVLFFTVQADQQSSIVLHDAEGPPPVLYHILYIFAKVLLFFFLVYLDSETSVSSDPSPVPTGKTEVCLSSFTELALRRNLAGDKYFSSKHLIWYLSQLEKCREMSGIMQPFSFCTESQCERLKQRFAWHQEWRKR